MLQTCTVTVTVDLFSSPPRGYTTSKLGQILARIQDPELSSYYSLLQEGVGLVVHFPLEDVAKINTP